MRDCIGSRSLLRSCKSERSIGQARGLSRFSKRQKGRYEVRGSARRATAAPGGFLRIVHPCLILPTPFPAPPSARGWCALGRPSRARTVDAHPRAPLTLRVVGLQSSAPLVPAMQRATGMPCRRSTLRIFSPHFAFARGARFGSSEDRDVRTAAILWHPDSPGRLGRVQNIARQEDTLRRCRICEWKCRMMLLAQTRAARLR